MPEHLISMADAAARYDLSVKTIRRRVADGTLSGYRVGRLLRVDAGELERLIRLVPTAGAS